MFDRSSRGFKEAGLSAGLYDKYHGAKDLLHCRGHLYQEVKLPCF